MVTCSAAGGEAVGGEAVGGEAVGGGTKGAARVTVRWRGHRPVGGEGYGPKTGCACAGGRPRERAGGRAAHRAGRGDAGDGRQGGQCAARRGVARARGRPRGGRDGAAASAAARGRVSCRPPPRTLRTRESPLSRPAKPSTLRRSTIALPCPGTVTHACAASWQAPRAGQRVRAAAARAAQGVLRP